MKKIGLGLLLVLLLGAFASCEDDNQELLNKPLIDTPAGGEDEDDPVNSGGGG